MKKNHMPINSHVYDEWGLEFYEFMAVKNIIEQQIESYLLMVEHDAINQNERDHGWCNGSLFAFGHFIVWTNLIIAFNKVINYNFMLDKTMFIIIP